MRLFRMLSLVLFAIYLALFPGVTIVVALDRVPAWGGWMGGALLIGQGAIVLGWLLGNYGRRGALAALLVFLLAWGVEHVGVTTGFPFGRYSYTEILQPQFFGVVPLAIACAWLMVAIGAWQIATANVQAFKRSNVQTLVAVATLVLLLDLQIETVATRINSYWVWLSSGAYYGVPAANFVAWWLVGLGMALVVARVLDDPARGARDIRRRAAASSRPALETLLGAHMPACLYVLSTLMFAVVNLARGYTVAGLVGVAVLLALALAAMPHMRAQPIWRARPHIHADEQETGA